LDIHSRDAASLLLVLVSLQPVYSVLQVLLLLGDCRESFFYLGEHGVHCVRVARFLRQVVFGRVVEGGLVFVLERRLLEPQLLDRTNDVFMQSLEFLEESSLALPRQVLELRGQ